MPLDMDQRLTFDNFIVGSANRLAAAAARRVAESPGTAYNPLFIYSASGLGKTHLIGAIGNHIRRVHPQLNVMYDTLEHLMDGVMSAIHAGERDAFRKQIRDINVLLLDDVQFLAGRHAAQEELLRAWDGISARGGQLVLASDRPPREIDDLDQRLLSRFSGGLATDVGAPDYETRVAIVTRKAEERGQPLSPGVAEALAKVSVANVRELQGALNRVLAVQELDGRAVTAAEVSQLLGPVAASPADEFGAYVDDISGTMVDIVAHIGPEQLLGDAIMRFEREGFRTVRLENALAGAPSLPEAEALVAEFERDVERLNAIATRIRDLDGAAPELARIDLLRNPDRVPEAEALLAEVGERMGPLPEPPQAPTFEELRLSAELLPVRAARAVALQPGERYNPFYVHGPAGSGKTALLVALARELMTLHPDLPLAFTTGERFSSELIAAITRNQVDSWRARYRRASILVIDGVDALVGTERAQEELFHLYDAVRRNRGQLIFSAACPPRALADIEDRLRSRLDSGLVIDLAPAAAPDAAAAPELPEAAGTDRDAAAPAAAPEPAPATAGAVEMDEWFQHSDKVLWKWPYAQETLVLELD